MPSRIWSSRNYFIGGIWDHLRKSITESLQLLFGIFLSICIPLVSILTFSLPLYPPASFLIVPNMLIKIIYFIYNRLIFYLLPDSFFLTLSLLVFSAVYILFSSFLYMLQFSESNINMGVRNSSKINYLLHFLFHLPVINNSVHGSYCSSILFNPTWNLLCISSSSSEYISQVFMTFHMLYFSRLYPLSALLSPLSLIISILPTSMLNPASFNLIWKHITNSVTFSPNSLQ